MTSVSAVGDAVERTSAGSGTASALRNLSESALGYASKKASLKIDEWGDRLNGAVASGGASEGAGWEAVWALLEGRNPVLAAIRGGWQGASGKLRVVVILLIVLVLALSPVMLVLLVLGLIVAGLGAAIRSAAG